MSLSVFFLKKCASDQTLILHVAERYLQEMHNGHGFKGYMFKLVADAYSQSVRFEGL